MNDENVKYKNLEKDNNKSKESLDKISQNSTNEINKLKEDLEKYKKENAQLKLNLDKYQKETEKLKSDLIKANKIISGIQNNQNNQIDNNELKNLRDENIKLKYELTLKENEIKDLKDRIQKNSKEEKKFGFDDIIVVNFVSMDSTVQCGIKCLPTDTFAEVEEKLYKRYDNLRDTNNMFTANAKPVLRFKKIFENNIKDGDILQLFKLE